MDEFHLTRSDLESMTTAELLRVADYFGINIPPGLDRIFVIEELLDLISLHESLEEEGASFESLSAFPPSSAASALKRGAGGEEGPRTESAPEALARGGNVFSPEDPDPKAPPRAAPAANAREDPSREGDFAGSVPFPKQYSITFIEVMIRDPLWAFAFWEIKEHDREIFEQAAGFEGYCLRIKPLEGKGKADPLPGFTVPIGPEDTAWYIGFPSENTGCRFQVELCASAGGRIDVLASSRIFNMPRLQERAGLPQRFSELALLSGAEEFPILRNPERKARYRHGQESRQPGE
ncbi:MAG: DUF4912 domain-containing protein [Treponema sp.]|jgi:hypothetical protein|nr:DUF4912 domain-containing protein [Treponema sp.]